MAIDLFGSFAGVLPNLFKVGLVVGQMIILFVVVGFLAYLFYNMLFYNIQVIIYERRGNSYIMRRDRGRVKKVNGVEEFVLLKRKKVSLEPPTFEHYQMNNKGKRILSLLQYGEEDFAPIKVNDLFSEVDNQLVTPVFEATESDVKNWHVQRQRRIMNQFNTQDFLEKYAGYLVFLVGMIVVGAVTWYMLGRIENLSGAINGASEPIRQGIEVLTQNCNPNQQNADGGAF